MERKLQLVYLYCGYTEVLEYQHDRQVCVTLPALVLPLTLLLNEKQTVTSILKKRIIFEISATCLRCTFSI